MTPRQIIELARRKGVRLDTDGESVTYEAPADAMTPELVSAIKSRKPEIIRALLAGNCEKCPAAGYWDYAHYAGKMQCFAYAYFFGKSGKPKPCECIRHDCPLKQKEGKPLDPDSELATCFRRTLGADNG